MRKNVLLQIITETGNDLIGGLFIGIGIYNFAANAGFPMAGVSGLALILYRLFHLPIGLSVLLMNVPISVICYRRLGHGFFLRSLRTIFTTSLVIDYLVPLLPVYTGDRMLAAICTGVASGIGYAWIFRHDSSTGGMDFITLSIRARYPHLSIGKILFVLDCIIVLLGGLILGEMDALLYGLIITYLLTTVMDRILSGIDRMKTAWIVTDDGQRVSALITQRVDRGSTILHGTGSYTGLSRDIVLCACSHRQMYALRNIIKYEDPQAFLIIVDSTEVVGEGFQKE